MQNYKRKLGNQGFGDYGSNNYLQSSGTELQWITFKDFTGLSGVNAREDTLPQFSPDALDVYVTENDRLTVVPGTVLFEQFVGHNPSRVALHTALNYTSDLVLFDAPSLGIKHEGATQWYNVGLPTGRPYTWANFGGTLLFSNGNLGMYAREQGGTTVELVEGAPAARAYASWAGRVWAGHAIIDGNREPLGLAWNAASGDYHDWMLFDENGAVTGAGFELLIDDMAAGDALVALRPMGLDFMAIMLRNSIWIATRTGNALRPGDFQPRVPGVGAINAECCKTTRFGVIFLADGPGIYLFNGNSADFISDEITSQLKTLSRTELASCTAEYNPLNRCYYLFTSIGTFVYDFERKRWHRRSMLAIGGTVFATQMVGPTWAEITGSWADQDEVWQDLNPEQEDDLVFYLLGTRGADGALDNEDTSSNTAFGLDLDPYWEFPLSEGLYSTQLITTKQVIINYDISGTIELEFPDVNGAYETARTAVLAGTGPSTLPVFGEHTGKGVGLRISFTSGKASLTRIQLGVILRGPRIEHIEPPPPTQFYTDFSTYATGALPAEWLAVGNASLSIIDSPWISPTTGVSVPLSGGKGMLVIGNSTVIGGALWTVPGSVGEVEIVMKFISSSGTSPSSFYILARMLNALTAAPCYVGGGYTFSQGAGSRSRFDYWDGAVKTQLAIGGGLSIGNNVMIGSRFSITGAGALTRLQSKVWFWNENAADFGESTALFAPAVDLDYTDVGGALRAALGMVGIGLFINSPTRQYVVDRFGVGVNGSPAPLEPL